VLKLLILAVDFGHWLLAVELTGSFWKYLIVTVFRSSWKCNVHMRYSLICSMISCRTSKSHTCSGERNVPWFMCWFQHYINCLFGCLPNFLPPLLSSLVLLSLCFLSYLFTSLLVYFLTYLSTPSWMDSFPGWRSCHRRWPNLALVFLFVLCCSIFCYGCMFDFVVFDLVFQY